MSKYYIKQKVFSWKDRFTVKNESGEDVYYVEGSLFSLGKKLDILDSKGTSVLYIEQKLWNWLPTYALYVQGEEVAQVEKELSFLKPRYTIHGPDWDVEGPFLQHNYQMLEKGRPTATVEKEWFTWGDSYELTVHDDEAALLALGIMIVIDCVMEAEAYSANT